MRLGPSLGHDLHHRAGAAILVGPGTAGVALDHDPAALGEDLAACRPGPAATITVKNDASCSRRPDHGHPEYARAIPLGVADLGLVGEVAGKANTASAGASLQPGRAACPELGGRTPWHAEPQGQAMEPTKSAMHQFAGCGQLRCPGWLAECLRLGVGHARNRPARSLHPGRENEAPTTRAARSSSQARVAGRQKTSVLHQLR